MDTSNLTPRQILEIKGAFLFLILSICLGTVSVVFQAMAGVNIQNTISTLGFLIFMVIISSIIYRRKKSLKSALVFEWIGGTGMLLATMFTKYRYAGNMDWTYAAQGYHLAAISVGFIVMTQFLYNKNLFRVLALVFFINWAVFLVLASSNDVTIYMQSIVDGKIVHDGIQIHREIYYIILMGIITFVSYRNMPIMEDYGHKYEKQGDLIRRQAEAQHGLSVEIKRRLDDLFQRLESQNRSVETINDSIQSQAATFEQVSAAMEELLASAEGISGMAVNQLGENKKMDGIIGEFKRVREETNRNLDLTLDDMSTAVSKTSTGHEKIGAVTSTMAEISEQSKRISETVSVIIDIADKINLLSLNASIEAARAGDYGRGFAVVADEIGKLAVQTTDSIKEISSVLSLSSQTTANGVQVIGDAAVIIRDMIDNIAASSDKIKLLKDSMAQEQGQIEGLIGQMQKNMEISRSINQGTTEQKQAITGSNTAIEQVNSVVMGMADAVNNLAALSKNIFDDAKLILDKSIEAAE